MTSTVVLDALLVRSRCPGLSAARRTVSPADQGGIIAGEVPGQRQDRFVDRHHEQIGFPERPPGRASSQAGSRHGGTLRASPSPPQSPLGLVRGIVCAFCPYENITGTRGLGASLTNGTNLHPLGN